MGLEAALTVIAILIGPVIAVLISLWVGQKISDRKQWREFQFTLLTTLVAYQWQGVSEENTRALNAIDLFFHDVPKVREKWQEFFDSLCRRDLPIDEAVQLWREKRIKLVHEMAKHLGLAKNLSQLDFGRIYAPKGLAPDYPQDPEMIDELIEKLRQHKAEITKETPMA